MTVAAKLLDSAKDCYEVTYDGASGSGEIEATFENPENGDISVYAGSDDGKFITTVAQGYQGEANVTVTKDGDEVDAGTVTFG